MFKLIHQSMYNKIEYKSGEDFVDIGDLETFQYVILTLDYIQIILMSMTILRYVSRFVDQVAKTEIILNQFLKKWILPLTFLLILYAGGFGLYIFITTSKKLYGFNNYFVSLLTMMIVNGKGQLFGTYALSDYEKYSEYVQKYYIIFFAVAVGHLFIKYLIINLGIAAFVKEYDDDRLGKNKGKGRVH